MSLLSRRSKSTNKAARRRRPSLRPDFELLEDRRLLAPLNFLVTNTNDSGLGSLRQEILDANANPGLDTIDFATGLSGTIVLKSGELQITNDVTIDGPGANLLTVSGNNTSRIFNIDDGNLGTALAVAISGLKLTGGNAGSDSGGAIFNAEALTLTNSTLSGNSAGWSGGGIYNEGTMTLTNSTLSDNSAHDGGGIFIVSAATLTNSTLSGNSAIDPAAASSSPLGQR